MEALDALVYYAIDHCDADVTALWRKLYLLSHGGSGKGSAAPTQARLFKADVIRALQTMGVASFSNVKERESVFVRLCNGNHGSSVLGVADFRRVMTPKIKALVGERGSRSKPKDGIMRKNTRSFSFEIEREETSVSICSQPSRAQRPERKSERQSSIDGSRPAAAGRGASSRAKSTSSVNQLYQPVHRHLENSDIPEDSETHDYVSVDERDGPIELELSPAAYENDQREEQEEELSNVDESEFVDRETTPDMEMEDAVSMVHLDETDDATMIAEELREQQVNNHQEQEQVHKALESTRGEVNSRINRVAERLYDFSSAIASKAENRPPIIQKLEEPIIHPLMEDNCPAEMYDTEPPFGSNDTASSLQTSGMMMAGYQTMLENAENLEGALAELEGNLKKREEEVSAKERESDAFAQMEEMKSLFTARVEELEATVNVLHEEKKNAFLMRTRPVSVLTHNALVDLLEGKGHLSGWREI